MISRRVIFSMVPASLLGLSFPARGTSTWRPTRPVTCIIPFSPGGGTDVVFRHLQSYAGDRGITMSPEYRSGADGLLGMRASASSPPDGHHLVIGTIGTMSHQRDGWDAAQAHRLITGLRGGIFWLVTGTQSGIMDVPDLLRRLRNGSVITGGSGAPGQRAAMEGLLRSAGIEGGMIANYRGAAGVLHDLLGNHVQWGMVPGSVAQSAVRSGNLRLLATDRRTGDLGGSDVPSIFDFIPEYPRVDSHLVAGPAQMPDATFDFWQEFFHAYLHDPSTIAHVLQDHGTMVPFGAPYLHERIDLFRRTVVSTQD